MSFVESLQKVKGQFSYEEETEFKTRPTNIDQFLALDSIDLPMPDKDAESVYAPGGGRVPIYSTTNRKWTLDGSFSYRVQNGQFLGAAIGKCATTGSDPYEHLLSVDQIPSWGMAYGIDAAADVIAEFLGCKVDQATLKASEDDLKLVCDIDFKACKPADGASLESVSPLATVPYVLKQGTFTSTSFYTGAKARIYGFEAIIKNNLKEIYAPGNFYPYDLVNGYQEYELKLNVGLEDDAEWDEILDATDKTYDYSMLFNRGTDDDLTISGNAKLKSSPWNVDENDIRAELVFLPISLGIEVNDSIATYSFTPA